MLLQGQIKARMDTTYNRAKQVEKLTLDLAKIRGMEQLFEAYQICELKDQDKMRRFFYWVGEKVKGVFQPLIVNLTTTQSLLTKYRAAYPKFQESLEEESEEIGSPFQSPTALQPSVTNTKHVPPHEFTVGSTRGEGITEVPTEEPDSTPVQVISENAGVRITEQAAEELSPNLPLSKVDPEHPTETMVKTKESQPSKRKKIPIENVPIWKMAQQREDTIELEVDLDAPDERRPTTTSAPIHS